ncbi:MAG: YncE family protein [Deltaproteobacteria bacterium]|nr:YncE family protein [Deltaproteobacteria bacterium]
MTKLGISGLCFCAVACSRSPEVAKPKHTSLALVSLDQKMHWTEEKGMVPRGPGSDSVLLLDLGNPATPRIASQVALANSVIGPPTNLKIAPGGQIALVANSMQLQADGPGWKTVPFDGLHVLDLSTSPPHPVGVVKTGLQPSGVAFAPDGKHAITANRAGRSISLLGIDGIRVTTLQTLPLDGEAADVAFTPDGKRALISLNDSAAVQIVLLEGDSASVGARVAVGPFPYSIVVVPGGVIALVGEMGNKSGGDGIDDAVSVIDLSVEPPVVIQTLVVGDGPEGLAVSADGKLAVAVAIRGGNSAAASGYYHKNAVAVGIAIDGKSLRRLNQVEVGVLGEGVVFGPDGRHVYVANFLGSDLSVLRFDGETLVDTGHRLVLPGQPASMQ